jgi:hypothetical protein
MEAGGGNLMGTSENTPDKTVERSQVSPTGTAARGVALLLTNLTKLAGLAVGLNEAIIRADGRAGVLAFAAFMIAGGQLSETALLAVIDRLFGTQSK